MWHSFMMKFVRRLPIWASEDDYAYADSHLLSRDYFMLFTEMILKFGLVPAHFLQDFSF